MWKRTITNFEPRIPNWNAGIQAAGPELYRAARSVSGAAGAQAGDDRDNTTTEQIGLL